VCVCFVDSVLQASLEKPLPMMVCIQHMFWYRCCCWLAAAERHCCERLVQYSCRVHYWLTCSRHIEHCWLQAIPNCGCCCCRADSCTALQLFYSVAGGYHSQVNTVLDSASAYMYSWLLNRARPGLWFWYLQTESEMYACISQCADHVRVSQITACSCGRYTFC
jgi:hypothetical protein